MAPPKYLELVPARFFDRTKQSPLKLLVASILAVLGLASILFMGRGFKFFPYKPSGADRRKDEDAGEDKPKTKEIAAGVSCVEREHLGVC